MICVFESRYSECTIWLRCRFNVLELDHRGRISEGMARVVVGERLCVAKTPRFKLELEALSRERFEFTVLWEIASSVFCLNSLGTLMKKVRLYRVSYERTMWTAS